MVTILRTDGREEIHEVPRKTFRDTVSTLIGAVHLETLRVVNGFMILDEDGYDVELVDHGPGRFEGEEYVLRVERRAVHARKPVNAKATALYHEVCPPGTTHEIVGDVAFVKE